MVDSSDKKSELISKTELFNLLTNEDLRRAAILIYANKQDLPEAMTVAEITEKMSLTEIKEHEWHIQVIMKHLLYQDIHMILTMKGLQR